MTVELQQLMTEINRKFVAQRRTYEIRINELTKRLCELENELASKQATVNELTNENVELRRKFVENSPEISSQMTFNKKTLSTVDVECGTDSWHDVLEDELKKRLDAFVELCQQACNNGHATTIFPSSINKSITKTAVGVGKSDRRIQQNPENSSFVTPSKFDHVWQQVFDDSSQINSSTPKAKYLVSNSSNTGPAVALDETLLNSTGFSESTVKTLANSTRRRRIDELEQSLTRGYDELTAQAAAFMAKKTS